MCALPIPSYADLDSVMESVLNGMANTTSSDAYTAANRGVVSFGSVSARTKIFSNNIVSLTLPEFSGGCGGIDMFGGSFSFINMQQFIQLMRAIAANSIGLLFNIAIDYIDSLLGTNLRGFLTWIQRLNGLLSNSCRLAKGIIAQGANALSGSMDERLAGSFARNVGNKGIYDEFSAWWKENPFEEGPKAGTQDENIEKGLYGNVVWEGLKKAGEGTFSVSGSAWNVKFMRQLMSLTGTVIVTEPNTNSGTDTPAPQIYSEDATLELKVFVEGYKDSSGNKQTSGEVFLCSDNEHCLTITGTEKFEPRNKFKDYIEKQFCGDDVQLCNNGILAKYANATNGDDLSSDEKAVVVNLPMYMGRYLKAMTTLSRGQSGTVGDAGKYITENSSAIAAYLAYHMLEEAIKDVKKTLIAAGKQPGAEEANKKLSEKLSRLHDEYMEYTKEVGSVEKLEEKAHYLISTIPNIIQASDMYKKTLIGAQ